MHTINLTQQKFLLSPEYNSLGTVLYYFLLPWRCNNKTTKYICKGREIATSKGSSKVDALQTPFGGQA